MEEELLTTPEAETEDTVEITDGEPEVSEAPQQTESLTLAEIGRASCRERV